MILVALTSCNQEKIDELENEVSRLEKENNTLKSHIEELEEKLEEAISNYESYSTSQRNLRHQREWYQQRAQQYLRDAEFWRQNGNEFLYESSMRNAQQELNMIP